MRPRSLATGRRGRAAAADRKFARATARSNAVLRACFAMAPSPLTSQHHAFMQWLMARGSAPEADARQLYKDITHLGDGARAAQATKRECASARAARSVACGARLGTR